MVNELKIKCDNIMKYSVYIFFFLSPRFDSFQFDITNTKNEANTIIHYSDIIKNDSYLELKYIFILMKPCQYFEKGFFFISSHLKILCLIFNP